MIKIYHCELEQQIKFIFQMYDFDNDGYISKEDMRTILSYVPIKNKLINNQVSEPEGKFTLDGGG